MSSRTSGEHEPTVGVPNYLYIESPPGETPEAVAFSLSQREAMHRFGNPNAKHTPPSALSGHYPHLYMWDSAESAKVFARHGFINEAVEEVYEIFKGMREDGFIPNMHFAQKGRYYDPERWLTFMDRRKSSDYSQAPILAETVQEIYENYIARGFEAEGKQFLIDIYPKLNTAYEYFTKNRRVSNENPLIFNVHPCETGRDSCPTFDFIKKRLTRNGVNTPKLTDIYNSAADYFGNIAVGIKNKKLSWEPKNMHQTFKVADVMFNSMFVKNKRDLANIASIVGNVSDQQKHLVEADEVAKSILEKMYDPADGVFYAQNYTSETTSVFNIGKAAFDKTIQPEPEIGVPIKTITISNLFPLQLIDLPLEQLESTVKLIEKSFTTNFILPSVATDNSEYDPHYQQKNMWRGPVWLWTNDFLAESLKLQSMRRDLPINPATESLLVKCQNLSSKIYAASEKLVSKENNESKPEPTDFTVQALFKHYKQYRFQDQYIGEVDNTYSHFWEFYDPITGQGYRIRPFSGSAIACKRRDVRLIKDRFSKF